MKITIDSNKRYQKFEGIGASGAWLAQVVGGWNHIDSESGMEVRDRISELLYNKDNGIGMRTYRYNIGAGSKHSGKGEYSMPARSTECFEISKGVYDWNRDANAVYMMKQAVKNGAEEVIFFVNSPPERITKNGMAHADKGKLFKENLSSDYYEEFADFCLEVTEHFVSEGLPIKYLSPVNEPIWVWNGGQEGCHYKPWSVAKVFDVFADKLNDRPSLNSIKLSGAESGDLRWFNKSYTRFLLKNKKVLKYLDAVDVHSYCLPIPVPFNVPILNNRVGFLKRFRKWMDKNYPDIPVKMSEWCHMQGGRDKTMKSALVMAKTMFEDISMLNVTSWQHWISVSEVDYCDGLIYINLDNKSFETTKRLYATGNFSKYIPYNATRIEAVSEDKDLLVLAFEKDSEVTMIVINPTNVNKSVSVSSQRQVKVVVTDCDNDLVESIVDSNDIIISPESVNTLIFNI